MDFKVVLVSDCCAALSDREHQATMESIIQQFGGEFLARGGRSESYEGTPPGDRNVLIRFPSFEAAKAWYHSEEYAEAKALRMSASTSVQTIVEGL